MDDAGLAALRQASTDLVGADYRLEIAAAVAQLGKQFRNREVQDRAPYLPAETKHTIVSRQLRELARIGMLKKTGRGRWQRTRPSVYWDACAQLLAEQESLHGAAAGTGM